MITPAFNSVSLRMRLGSCRVSAGGRGELRCRGGETDTSVSVCSIGVCSFVNGSPHCPGCMVDGPSAMAATCVLLLLVLSGGTRTYYCL